MRYVAATSFHGTTSRRCPVDGSRRLSFVSPCSVRSVTTIGPFKPGYEPAWLTDEHSSQATKNRIATATARTRQLAIVGAVFTLCSDQRVGSQQPYQAALSM